MKDKKKDRKYKNEQFGGHLETKNRKVKQKEHRPS